MSPQDKVVLLVCHEGYSSSLDAQRLQKVGIPRVTDLIVGHMALVSVGSRSGPQSVVRYRP
jgi:rhodanese-related sulfurtransferase